jgi:centlein
MSVLISKLNDTETAMAQIETAASEQLQGLALQSEQVLEGAQKKLLSANEKIEEFTVFVKVGAFVKVAFLQAKAFFSF